MGYSEHFLTKVIHLKNILKNVLVCLTLATGSMAFASAPIDGAYACQVTYPGIATYEAYIAVVTNPQGVTAMAPVALTTANRLLGYSTGAANSNTFNGLSQFNLPFNFSVEPGYQGFFGTMGILLTFGTFNTPVSASVHCNRIW